MRVELVSVYLVLLYTLIHLNFFMKYFFSIGDILLYRYCSDFHEVLRMHFIVLLVTLPSPSKDSEDICGFNFTIVGCILGFIIWSGLLRDGSSFLGN